MVVLIGLILVFSSRSFDSRGIKMNVFLLKKIPLRAGLTQNVFPRWASNFLNFIQFSADTSKKRLPLAFKYSFTYSPFYQFRASRDAHYSSISLKHYRTWWYTTLFVRTIRHFAPFKSWWKFKNYQLFRKCYGGGHLTQYKSFITDKHRRWLIKPKLLEKLRRLHHWSSRSVSNLRAFTKAAKRHLRYRRYVTRRYGSDVLSQYKYYRKRKFFKIKNYLWSTYGRTFRAFIRRGSLIQVIHEYFYKLSMVETALEDKNYLLSKRFPRVYTPASIQNFFTRVNSEIILSFRYMYYCLMMRKKKNNYYFTVIDRLGGVVLHYSSGQFLLTAGDGKRNKKNRTSFKHLVDFIKKFTILLRKKKIFTIKHLFRPFKLRRKEVTLIMYILVKRGIIIETITNPSVLPHALPPKTKKARRL